MSRINVFVHHLRGGFATNCSSSHSLIYLPGAGDDLSNVHDGVYDWGWVAASRQAKAPYVRWQLEASGALEDAIARALGLPEQGAAGGDYYRWSGPPELLREIARWALEDGVVALGGPDNAEHHELSGPKAIDPADFGGSWTSRKDPLGFWTLLSDQGTRLRLSFARADHPHVRPFRSTWPELVDLKITDRCKTGCSFCSQDSRPDGAHAKVEDVVKLLDALAKAKVMEVVLGGGEPTEHPDFSKIVGEIQRRKMRAAFTTRRLDWFKRVQKKEANWRDVHWAYSLNRVEELDSLAGKRRWDETPLPAIHVVMGTALARRESLLAIARKCVEPWLQLVLLGYKATGRAAETTPLDDSHWFDTCTESGISRVSIDAVLAARYDLELQRRGVPPWLVDVEDGRYAMHVDAVRGTCGPSSFCARDEMFAIPSGDDPIEAAFSRINDRLGPARLQRALELEQDGLRRSGDEKGLVMLDAAMEGRCEACAAASSRPEGGVRGRPKLLCDDCASKEEHAPAAPRTPPSVDAPCAAGRSR